MGHKLSRLQIPRAYENYQAFRERIERYDVSDNFRLCWSVFNEIYSYIGQTEWKEGMNKRLANRLKLDKASGKEVVERAHDHVQLDYAFEKYDNDLKDKLITHESTKFFVNRIPMWERQPIEFDPQGKRLNGVINVGQTIDNKHPIWSPIDIGPYNQYMSREQTDEIRNHLVSQIKEVIYTVRCNLEHGRKSLYDENDMGVVQSAMPLLIFMVEYFLDTEI